MHTGHCREGNNGRFDSIDYMIYCFMECKSIGNIRKLFGEVGKSFSNMPNIFWNEVTNGTTRGIEFVVDTILILSRRNTFRTCLEKLLCITFGTLDVGLSS